MRSSQSSDSARILTYSLFGISTSVCDVTSVCDANGIRLHTQFDSNASCHGDLIDLHNKQKLLEFPLLGVTGFLMSIY